MRLFRRKKKTQEKRNLVKTIKIQGSVEGGYDSIMIESMLTGQRLNVSIPGTINAYATYDSQVTETYRKYNGFSSFGTQQLRACVDLRTAFIVGEGVSVSAKDEATANWIETFITKNVMSGINFINAVKGAEMTGQSLLLLRPMVGLDNNLYIKITRIPYRYQIPYRAVYKDPLIREEVIDVQIKKNGQWMSSGFKNFIYVRTGGDDSNSEGPVTKVGVVLTDIENYDRAVKDMRRNNHIFARITPVFEVETDSEATSLKTKLEGLKWKIGEVFIGKAKFKYETPERGAHENLNTELVATIKTISSVTGVPVHWLGYVDLMSNRSTAETLYEFIKNGTINERVEWEKSIYNMILKAQELYIDTGGKELPKLDPDFRVVLPLIDFGNFLERVRGLNLAYTDEAISIDDYRNAIPGIDPLKTARAIEEEKENEKNQLKAVGASISNEEGEND
jgi:hypothetical protein